MTPHGYILWDWNGTLLDDTQAALDTLNLMLARRGLSPIAMDFYRSNFRFPVRPFYESIGFRIRDEEWDALALEYHQTYLQQPKRLASDALEALDLARSVGFGQVVVSALRQDLLEDDIHRFGIADSFVGLYGTDNLDGASKLAAAKKAASALPAGMRLAVIGDSRHDLEAAQAVGAVCVLQSGGTHTRQRLEAMGPVADTLPEAVRLAAALVAQEGASK